MSRRLMHLIVIVVGAASHHVTVADAQATQQQVPRELVQQLLRGPRDFGLPEPELVVGSVPRDFPTTLLPSSGIRILGGMRFKGNDIGSLFSVVAVTRSKPDSLLSALYTSWQRAGWKHPVSRQMGGFLPPRAVAMANSFCNEHGILEASTSPRGTGESYLRVSLSTDQRETPCSAEARRGAPPWRDLDLPVLLAPPGVRMEGGGSSGSPGMRETSTALQTSMTPAQLVAHYVKQLQAQGWTLRESASTSNVVFQTAERKDASGQTLLGILSAYAMPNPRWRGISFKVFSRDAVRE